MKNELARELSLAEGKIQYDNSVKRVLANKRILAWILKYTVEEFADLPVEEISKCIGPDVEISETGVMPGMYNQQRPEKITGESEMDAVPGEGELYFDIRFSAYLRGKKERIKLLINVEAQKNFYPGYSLTTRGVFYGARMISAQKGTEFAGSDYDRIRKVYSIWICMNAPDYIGNAISMYRITKEDPLPGIPDEKRTYDKLTVVMICLNAESQKGNPLTRMLGLLLSPKIKVKVKIQQLKEEFEIPTESKAIGEELNQMCNLSDYVEELGIEQGREQLLLQIVEKKLARGISVSEIADALEETEETIRQLVNKLQQA